MATKSSTNRRWTTWLKIAGTLVSMGLLVWLLSRLDLPELLTLASRVPIGVLLLSIVLLTTRVFAHTFRWRSLLKGQLIDVRYRELLGLQYGSFFASNFLPTTVGGTSFAWSEFWERPPIASVGRHPSWWTVRWESLPCCFFYRSAFQYWAVF